MDTAAPLRPVDIPVALALIAEPHATYPRIAELLGISASTAHDAIQRLRRAGLVRASEAVVVRPALLEFLTHGVRYAFPAVLQSDSVGVPTAHAGPALTDVIAADVPYVWPSAAGSSRGPSVSPLFKQAPELPRRSPEVYRLLTLVDALRVGQVRERNLAVEMLRERMYAAATPLAA